MSLITTNSKVERNPAHYSNNYPQPIEIKPNSQICLQKFIHTRDTDNFDITGQNNALIIKFGSPAGADNPERQVILNRGVYSGDQLATEIQTKLNAQIQQQNFFVTVAYNGMGVNPTKQFDFELIQRPDTDFALKGGEWTTTFGAPRVDLVNNDVDDEKTKITFKEVGGEYGDICMMRRGMLTHGGQHEVEGIRRDASTNKLQGVGAGVVSNFISKETGTPPPANGTGNDFGTDFQDIQVNFKTDALGVETIDVDMMEYGGSGGGRTRRRKECRTLPQTVVDAIFALTNFRDLKVVITTIQHSGAVKANGAGDWLVQLFYYNENTTNYEPVPDGTGGNLPYFGSVNTHPAVSTQTVAGINYQGVIFWSRLQVYYQFGVLLIDAVKPARAAYIPTVFATADTAQEQIAYYDLEGANIWGSNFPAQPFSLEFEPAPANQYDFVFRARRRDTGTNAIIDYRWCSPVEDTTRTTDLSLLDWNVWVGTANELDIPDGSLPATFTATLSDVNTAAPVWTQSNGGAFTGVAQMAGILVPIPLKVNGYYNFESRQTSPPTQLALDKHIAVEAVEDDLDAVPEEVVGVPPLLGNNPPAVAPLPRGFLIWLERDEGLGQVGTYVATMRILLGFTRGTSGGGNLGLYFTNDAGGNQVPPVYPFTLTNTQDPNTIAGDTTLHIAIPQLNNIKTYEGARLDSDITGASSLSASNGDITNTIAVIPRQEFQSDRDTGELVYVAPYENWIDIKNAATLLINQITVLVRNADGTLAGDLTRETTAIFKIREDPITAAQLREDARMERFTKMIMNQQDRMVQFTGS